MHGLCFSERQERAHLVPRSPIGIPRNHDGEKCQGYCDLQPAVHSQGGEAGLSSGRAVLLLVLVLVLDDVSAEESLGHISTFLDL
jgi:hypothetical protein